MADKAVSSWSLHRTLGNAHSGDGPSGTGEVRGGSGVDLLELPALLHKHGYTQLQLCHFHLPSTDPEYLAEFKDALHSSGVALDALLIDDGNLVDPVHGDRDFAWIDGWVSVAAELGAKYARVCGGRLAPTHELLALSATRLQELATTHPGVRVITENWLELLNDADSVLTVLDRAGEDVGFMVDLGNWVGADKYENLERVAGRAQTCHAKCHFSGDTPDEEDFRRSLQILRAAGFTGSIALIYDGPNDDEWGNLEREHAMVQEVFDSAEVV